MTILVGYTPDKGGPAALDLGAQLARSGTVEPLVVAIVVPRPWRTPSMAKVDAEFAAWASEQGASAITEAKAHLAATSPDVAVSFRAVEGPSVPKALLAAAAEAEADLLVLGSGSEGAHGQVVVGTTAGPLLHSSPLPIALAPRGYRARSHAAVTRVTCAYSGSESSGELLAATARWASRLGVSLRIVTFGVRGRTMYPPEIGLRSEDDVLAVWSAQASTASATAVESLRAAGLLPSDVSTVLASGSDWPDAFDSIEWDAGEMLVVGSSSIGPVARVFLGSKAIKVVRHAPVPVILVPSGEAAEQVLAVGPVAV